MPRKLPWLKDAESRPRCRNNASVSPSRQQRAQTRAAGNELSSNARPERSRKAGERRDRTPSTSPPPHPPTQEFMKDGLEGDDIWVMVEDEFLDTARLFTQHLHHAEYQRLKRLARARNEPALQKMSRPVDPRSEMSAGRSKTNEAKIRAEKQTKRLQSIGAENVEVGRNSDDSEDDATPWMFDPHLGGLMAGNPPGSSQKLAKLAGSKSKTRAAAGFQATKHKTMKAPSPASRSANVASISKSNLDGLAQELAHAAASDNEVDSDDLDVSPLRRASSKCAPLPSIPSRTKDVNPKEQRKISDPLAGQRRSLSKRPWLEEDESGEDSAFQKPRLTDAATHISRSRPSASEEPVSRASSRASVLSRAARPSIASLWASTEDEPVQGNTLTQSPLSGRRRVGAKDEKKKSNSVDEIPTFLF